MNPSDKDGDDFDPPLIHEEEIEPSATGDEEKESEEKRESSEVEENKEQTEVVTKEALLRVPSGQL